MANPVTAIQKIYSETVTEMKKCTWPSKNEIVRSTSVVLSSMVILTVTVMVLDWICQGAVSIIAGLR